MKKVINSTKSGDDNEESDRKQLSKIKISNIIYPILIGLGVVAYMIWNEYDAEAISQLTFTSSTFWWLFIAILFMFGRDFGYIIRIKTLAAGEVTWLQAFRIIMLWEFTSAITPSAIGGTSFAIIYVHKEGINLGKSSSIVLLTSFLDELYFAVMFPLLIILLGNQTIFGSISEGSEVYSSIMTIAITGYSLKLAYILLISYGLFINPNGFKWLLNNLFKIKFLRRWHAEAMKTADDIVVSSKEIKKRNISFWLKVISSTFLSWSSRYLVANAILLGFFATQDHLLLFARQLVMWIMMLVMPTPGGSGISEYLFSQYLSDFIPVAGLAVVMALIWRIITYYPYLFIGAVMFPRWVSSKFSKKNK